MDPGQALILNLYLGEWKGWKFCPPTGDLTWKLGLASWRARGWMEASALILNLYLEGWRPDRAAALILNLYLREA